MLIIKKKRYTKTTDSRHWIHRYPNLINDFVPAAPEELWVADITYVRSLGGFRYLHLITNGYSKKVIGYELSRDLAAASTLKALRMALAARSYNDAGKGCRRLIHHSDRGLQYCSADYTTLLRLEGICISMTESGEPYDNAVAERVNGILKDEFGLDATFGDDHLLSRQTARAIAIYNQHRPHISNGLLTPEQMHRQQQRTIRKWNKSKQPIEPVPAQLAVISSS